LKRRIPKTPATVIGDDLRKTAIAYKADGQSDRAEGMIDAANRIDAWLFAQTKAPVHPLELCDPVEVPKRGRPQSSTQAGNIEERLSALEENLGNLAALVASGARKPEPASSRPKEIPELLRMPAILRPPAKAVNGVRRSQSDPLSRCERKILTASAQIGGDPSEDVLLLLTGYRHTGSWIEAMASLRRSGFLDGTRITEEGMRAVGPVEMLPRGEQLIAYWEQKLGRCAGSILRYVIDFDAAVPEEIVLEATEYKKSGSWIEAVSKLRKLHLLTPRGDFRIPDETRALLTETSR
jgi:hypothetical protein